MAKCVEENSNLCNSEALIRNFNKTTTLIFKNLNNSCDENEEVGKRKSGTISETGNQTDTIGITIAPTGREGSDRNDAEADMQDRDKASHLGIHHSLLVLTFASVACSAFGLLRRFFSCEKSRPRPQEKQNILAILEDKTGYEKQLEEDIRQKMQNGGQITSQPIGTYVSKPVRNWCRIGRDGETSPLSSGTRRNIDV
ncbi:hypothetical protein PoB_002785600 [Plakobranchus ocellatus]|uniref:Uncharacterized protein n=1 Tax=Plakobranchus ocellatus TaxID=259542 RepID=A0AAV4A3T7_9GAST|nr:hypothetical protein PoB_002785600 [Plakobranchus ocellatus]